MPRPSRVRFASQVIKIRYKLRSIGQENLERFSGFSEERKSVSDRRVRGSGNLMSQCRRLNLLSKPCSARNRLQADPISQGSTGLKRLDSLWPPRGARVVPHRAKQRNAFQGGPKEGAERITGSPTKPQGDRKAKKWPSGVTALRGKSGPIHGPGVFRMSAISVHLLALMPTDEEIIRGAVAVTQRTVLGGVIEFFD